MKVFSIQDIRSWDPCYDPVKYLAEDWKGTVLDILRHEAIPPQDKLWAVCREDLIDAKTLRLFAVWCARQIEHSMTDERSIAALEVAERYANGKATDDELAAAWDAAWAASAAAWEAWSAARAAARYAAWSAAARAAAWSAARYAAGSARAAWAASAAARAAAAAGYDARYAAGSAAARAAARAAQVEHLIKMLGE